MASNPCFIIHYVMRALKTSRSCSRGQTYNFSNQNDLKNPKMGSKQSVTDAPKWVFYEITFFGTKKSSKNSDGFTSNVSYNL